MANTIIVRVVIWYRVVEPCPFITDQVVAICDEAILAEAASKSRVHIVDASVYDPNPDSSPIIYSYAVISMLPEINRVPRGIVLG